MDEYTYVPIKESIKIFLQRNPVFIPVIFIICIAAMQKSFQNLCIEHSNNSEKKKLSFTSYRKKVKPR